MARTDSFDERGGGVTKDTGIDVAHNTHHVRNLN